MVETDKLIDKRTSRNMATRMLKASSDERELTSIEKRLAQMSQRATFQILVFFLYKTCNKHRFLLHRIHM